MKNSFVLKVVLDECTEALSFSRSRFFVYKTKPFPSLARIWICPSTLEELEALLFSSFPLDSLMCAFVDGYDTCFNVGYSAIDGSFIHVDVDYYYSLVHFRYFSHEFTVSFHEIPDVLRHPCTICDFMCPRQDDCKGRE